MKDNLNIKIDGRGKDRLEIIEALLNSRNVDEFELLNPSENDLIPYDDMINLSKGFDLLYDSIFANCSRHDKILIHADVDVDGLTAYSIIYQYLKNYMPETRIKATINKGKVHGIENYDLNNLEDVDLMIIVDSINDLEEYKRILETGVKILILDHHIVSKEVIEFEKNNENICLISSANNYPNSMLSGSGVVWKFCRYFDDMTLNDYSDSLVDLAMTGIISDMCDVTTKENYYICHKGLTNIKNPVLKEFAKGYAFNGETITYGIAPVVNSAMRMLQNDYVLNIFNLVDKKEIKKKIEHLKFIKTKQNEEVERLLSTDTDIKDYGKLAVAVIKDNEYNLKGLIANAIMSNIQKPLICVTKYDNYYSGSARAIGVDNFLKISEVTNEIVFAKGHENAFGIKINSDNLDSYVKKVNEILDKTEFKNEITIDCQINPYQITTQFIDDIERLSVVTGEGYKPYKFMVELKANTFSVGTIKDTHTKITSADMNYIKWNDNNIEQYMGKDIIVIGTLNKSKFMGKVQKQMIIDKIIVKE